MYPLAAQTVTVWPLLVYVGAVVFTVAGMVLVSWVLGERRRRTPGVRHGTHRSRSEASAPPRLFDASFDAEAQNVRPYESGNLPTGSARLRFPTEFYLVAVFFVIFDIESVFVFAWAVAVRQAGWVGYVEVLVFIAVLVAALAYLWRVGALDWGTVRMQRHPEEIERLRESEPIR